MGFQVSRPNRVMADRAHLSGFTISAASGNRLRHVAQSKSQRNRSNNDYPGRPSPGACLCQLGFLFSCEFQLHDGEPARTFRRFLGGRGRHLLWAGPPETDDAPPVVGRGSYERASASPTRPRGGAAARPCRAPGLNPRSDRRRPRGRPTIGADQAQCRAPHAAQA
jgi:hypothetical protein